MKRRERWVWMTTTQDGADVEEHHIWGSASAGASYLAEWASNREDPITHSANDLPANQGSIFAEARKKGYSLIRCDEDGGDTCASLSRKPVRMGSKPQPQQTSRALACRPRRGAGLR
jgi:hypothetical protein